MAQHSLRQAVFHAHEPRHARVDVCVADTATGEVKPLIEERLNTYIETEAAAPDQQRTGADLLVRAGRLGPLLSLRRDTAR